VQGARAPRHPPALDPCGIIASSRLEVFHWSVPLATEPEARECWGDRPGDCRAEGGGERSELVDQLWDGPPCLAWRRGCSPQCRFAPGGRNPLGYLFVPPRPEAVWGDRPGGCRAEGGGERSELVPQFRTAPLGVACGSATPPNVASLLGGETPPRCLSPSRRRRRRAGGTGPADAGPRGVVSGANSSTTPGTAPLASPGGEAAPPNVASLLGGETPWGTCLSPLGRRPFGGTGPADAGPRGVVSVSELVDQLWDGPPRLAWRRGCSPQCRFAPGGRNPLGYLFVPPRPEAVWGDRPGDCRAEGGGERSELVDQLWDGPPRLAWRRGCSPQCRFAPGGRNPLGYLFVPLGRRRRAGGTGPADAGPRGAVSGANSWISSGTAPLASPGGEAAPPNVASLLGGET
jgi:hypothetical protein